MNVLMVFPQKALINNGDYFPQNQWISDDENCTDWSKPGPYLVSGTKGIYRVNFDLTNENDPKVTITMYDREFTLE